MRPGSKILIVGGRKENLQRDAREHDAIILWPSGLTGSLPQVPSTVSVILCTRFCGHQTSQLLREVVASRGGGMFLFSGLLQTGQVRKYITELLQLDQKSTHEGTSDELEDGPRPLPPLPPLPRKTERPFAQPAAITETPVTQPAAPSITSENPDAVLLGAVQMLDDGIAALQLAKDQLLRAKEQLARAREEQEQLARKNSEAAEKLEMLRSFFK